MQAEQSPFFFHSQLRVQGEAGDWPVHGQATALGGTHPGEDTQPRERRGGRQTGHRRTEGRDALDGLGRTRIHRYVNNSRQHVDKGIQYAVTDL